MRAERIWPNGLRYLWTDAFGVVLLASLHAESGRRQYLDETEWLVGEVDRVLGRPRGLIRLVFPTGLSECVHDLIHVLLSSEALKRLFETQQVGVGKVVQVH